MMFPFFGRKKETEVVEKKQATKVRKTVYNISPDSFLYQVFGNVEKITDYSAHELYRSTAAIATSVDMISEFIRQINPVLRSPDGKFVDDHEIISLLKKPNGFQNWQQFCEEVTKNYLLKHDAIITASGNIKYAPVELWPQSLQEMTVNSGFDNYPETYYVTEGMLTGKYYRTNLKGTYRFYDGNYKELYHIKGYSSRIDKTESDSPLQAAAQEARQIIKGKYHNIKVLENGGRLSLLIVFNDEDYIDEEEHDKRKKSINEQMAGENNAGSIGVISGADVSQVTEFGKSNKDMDFANLESMAGNAIYLRYGIPLALVTTEASTFDNLKTGIQFMYDNAVLPNANVIFQGLSWMLLPRFKIDPAKWCLTYNPESIEPLKQRKLDELTQRVKIGIETMNELRSLLPGKKPVKYGDTIIVRSNSAPLDSLFEDKTDDQTDSNDSDSDTTNK